MNTEKLDQLKSQLGPKAVSIVNRKLLIEALGTEVANELLPPLPPEIAVNTKRTLLAIEQHATQLYIQRLENSTLS
jgi:hypothetical protein